MTETLRSTIRDVARSVPVAGRLNPFNGSGGRMIPTIARYGCAHIPGEVASDDRRRLVAGLRDAPARVDPRQQHPADHEEDDEREDRRPVGVRPLVDQAEDQRPQPARAALAGLVEREVLRLAAVRDELAE